LEIWNLRGVLFYFYGKFQTDKLLWRIMFIIAAVIYAGTAAFFVTFLSAERQWWDAKNQPNSLDEEEKL